MWTHEKCGLLIHSKVGLVSRFGTGKEKGRHALTTFPFDFCAFNELGRRDLNPDKQIQS
jgi:hypothetical protein